MLPEELQQFRENLFHSQAEFAELLYRVCGIERPKRTIERWEHGRRSSPIPISAPDKAAIKAATTPQSLICHCGARAVVRKKDLDLCGPCAAPTTWQTRQRLAVGI